jgi:hypothetical protein
MTTDDDPKKRIMRGALDAGCGAWALAILPAAGVAKDEISATVFPFSRDRLSGSARASVATTPEAVEPNYLLMRVARSYERKSPWEERRLRSR